MENLQINFKKLSENRQEIIADLQEKWPDSIKLNNLSHRADLLDEYPFWVMAAFPSLRVQDIQQITIPGLLFGNSVLISDSIMDDGYFDTRIREQIMSLFAMQMEAYHIYYQIFPPDSHFWQNFRCYIQEYTDGHILEQKFSSGEKSLQELTKEKVYNMIILKISFFPKIYLAAMAELSDDKRYVDILTEATNNFIFAYQMYDDICDWKEDLIAGIPSLLLSRMVEDLTLPNNQEDREKYLKELAGKMYYHGHAHYILNLAIKHFDIADNLVAEIPNLLFRNVIAELRQKCQNLLDDIDKIVCKNLQDKAPIYQEHIKSLTHV